MAHQPHMTVGAYLIRRLEQLGLRHIFGVPGDYALTLFDFLEESGIELINTCNELNAGYAADGYGRVSGIGAVCLTYGVGGFSQTGALIVLARLPSDRCGASLSLASADFTNEDSCRGLVRARRPHFHNVDKLPKQLVGNGFILPFIVRAGFEEDLIQAIRSDRSGHRYPRRVFHLGEGYRPVRARSLDGLNLLNLWDEVLQQVFDAIAERGCRGRAT